MEIFYLLIGIAIFGVGLGIGWNMRGSVKEEDYHTTKLLSDKIDSLKWGIDELKKKVK